jgi:hypothetical protein
MKNYTVKINDVEVSKIISLTSKSVLTNRSGSFTLKVIDADNSLYNSIKSSDELTIFDENDVLVFGGIVEKLKRDADKKFILEITGGDYTTKANNEKVDILIYRKREFSVIVRDLSNKFIASSVLIDALDSVDGWSESSDFHDLEFDEDEDTDGYPFACLGDGCLKVQGTYSAGTGVLTKTMSSARTVNETDVFEVYFFIEDISKLGSSIDLCFGQDVSNYFEIELNTNSLSNGRNYLEFPVEDKTTGAGSPSLTAVDFYSFKVSLSAGASSEVIRFDDFRKRTAGYSLTGIQTTENYVDYIEFKNSSVLNCWKEISEIKSNIYNFFIDKEKVIHWGKFGTQASGVTLQRGTNIYKINLWDDDSLLKNKVRVYGKRQLFSYEETFNGDGSTNSFQLKFKPVEVYCEVGGTKQLGYQRDMTQETYDYSIDYENREIIFEDASIPAIGSDNVYFRYSYSVPIYVEAESSSSIDLYGERIKKIDAPQLNSRDDCLSLAQDYLSKYAFPIKNGVAECKIEPLIDVGETVELIHSTFDESEDFLVAGIENTYSGSRVLSKITLSNTRMDIEQYLSVLLNRLNALEEKEKGTTDLKTSIKTFIDSVTLSDNVGDLSVRTRAVNDSDTWYFGNADLCDFSLPIKFGGGSGAWSNNLLE